MLTLSSQLVVLHLTDSYCLTLPSLYVSSLLLSLRAMLQMDLPQLNVLTKIDKLSGYSGLAFNLDFYTEVQDLDYLVPHLEKESSMFRKPRFEALNKAIIELIEDFGLVGFETLAVEDKGSMMKLLQAIDRAGGYVFGGAEGANDTVWQVAMREGVTTMDIRDVQERWLDARDEFDGYERTQLEEEAARQNSPRRETPDDQPDDGSDVMEDLARPSVPSNGSSIRVVRRGGREAAK